MKKKRFCKKYFKKKAQELFSSWRRIKRFLRKLEREFFFNFFLKPAKFKIIFKKQLPRISFWLFFITLLLVFFPKINSNAKKYAERKYFVPRGITLFVEKNQNPIQNGSPEFPFSEIEPALELSSKNNSFRFIQVNQGVYETKEALFVPHRKNLIGKGLPTVKKITEDGQVIFFEGDGMIAGFKIEQGRYGIYISSQSQRVSLQNCQISGAKFFGVYNKVESLEKKDLHLNIYHCHVFENKKQGLYLQSGFFRIKSCLVEKNGEEGIDHHSNYTSLIENTIISQNGEGGIETELDRSFLTVKNSTITKNQNSGINLQTKSLAPSKIEVLDSQIEENGNFGIRCAIHSAAPYSYFQKRINLKETAKNNLLKNNGLREIDPNCFLF